jgi:hypothetical protein
MQETDESRGGKSLQNVLVVLTIFVFCGVFLPIGSAQTSRGTVAGTVKDPTGAVIPAGIVTLTNTDTSVSRETTTSQEGFYRFDAVDLGTYTIAVSAPRFGNLQRTDIRVSANQTAVVDVDMTLGGVEASVSVVAEPGVVLQTKVPVRGRIMPSDLSSSRCAENSPFDTHISAPVTLSPDSWTGSRGKDCAAKSTEAAHTNRTTSSSLRASHGALSQRKKHSTSWQV